VNVISQHPIECSREAFARDAPLSHLGETELRVSKFGGVEVLVRDRVAQIMQLEQRMPD
jgi:hypothetical protein